MGVVIRDSMDNFLAGISLKYSIFLEVQMAKAFAAGWTLIMVTVVRSLSYTWVNLLIADVE